MHDQTQTWSTQMFHAWWIECLEKENAGFKDPKEADMRKAREMRKYWRKSGLMTTSSRDFFKNPKEHFPDLDKLSSAASSDSLPGVFANHTTSDFFREGTNREKMWVRGRDHAMNNKSFSIRTMLEPTAMARKFMEKENMRVNARELLHEIKDRTSELSPCNGSEARSLSCAPRSAQSSPSTRSPNSRRHVTSGPLPSLPGRCEDISGSSFASCASALAFPNMIKCERIRAC